MTAPPPQAMKTLAKALKANPNRSDAIQLLYGMCVPLAKGTASCAELDFLIAADPLSLGLRSVAIKLCRAVNDRSERLKHLEVIYRQSACGEDYYAEYAAMLGYNGQYEQCITICEEALAQYPDSPGALRVRANMYGIEGKYDKALEAWAHVLALKPGDIQARMVIGMTKLLISDCREGFEDFTALRDRFFYQSKLAMPIPEWNGEALAGKRLLLWCNEGVGDVIMYAGLLPWLLSQGANVTLAMYPKLMPLVARSFPSLAAHSFYAGTTGNGAAVF